MIRRRRRSKNSAVGLSVEEFGFKLTGEQFGFFESLTSQAGSRRRRGGVVWGVGGGEEGRNGRDVNARKKGREEGGEGEGSEARRGEEARAGAGRLE